MTSRRDFVQGLAMALGGIPGAAAQEPATKPAPEAPKAPTEPTGSDVGSLYTFIRSQAVRGEFPLSYLRDEFRDLPAWKAQARGKFRDLLHYDPPRCDPKPEVVAKVECDGYTRETVQFNTTPDIRVPAYVLVPKGLTKPAPGIVALHDHGGMYFWGREKIVEGDQEHPVLANFKRGAYGGKSIASELARRGYVVVVIDMFYWGERRLILDADPADWRERPVTMPADRVAAFNRRSSESEALVARTIYSAGFTWSGVMFTDDQRTVDYLITRPEVDPNRIGCVGLSVGGLRSCHLAALDDRIKAAVVVGWMASYPAQLKARIRNTIGFTKLVPGLMQHMDYPDVASLAMPSALLVINGLKDGLFDLDGVRTCFKKLQACYAKAGAPEKFRGSFYDTPHEFNVEMQSEAWAWLERWL